MLDRVSRASVHGQDQRDETRSLLLPARRDPTAFTAFYRAYASRLLVYFARRVVDAEVAADLTGETFAIAYERRAQFRGSNAEQEQGWLFAIARRQLQQYWRKGDVEQRALERLGLQPPETGQSDIEYLERAGAVQEQRQKIASALGRLPTEQRYAVQARIVDERSYADIAKELTVNEQAVRARVSRGLKTLHRHLGHLTREEFT